MPNCVITPDLIFEVLMEKQSCSRAPSGCPEAFASDTNTSQSTSGLQKLHEATNKKLDQQIYRDNDGRDEVDNQLPQYALFHASKCTTDGVPIQMVLVRLC